MAAIARGERHWTARVASESAWNVSAIDRAPADQTESESGPLPSTPRARVVGASVPAAVTPTTSIRPSAKHEFTWLGAHGGAGTSSLARSTGVGGELTRQWPAPALGWPTSVAIVCRCNAAGLDAAAVLVRETASGAIRGATVLALVAVADSPVRPSKAIRRRLHELDSAVPAVLQLPWISAWRERPYTPHPTATRVAAGIAALLTTTCTHPLGRTT